MSEGNTLVPLYGGGASIRQTERRDVPSLLVLHLQCVFRFTLFTTLQSLVDFLITVKQNCTFISLIFF